MDAKPDFRRKLLDERNAIPSEMRHAEDIRIAELLCNTSQFKSAEYVLSYLSFGSEVDTRFIIEQANAMGKTVALPRCIKGTREMQWFEAGDLDNLERCSWGMEEPRPESCREIASDEYRCGNTIAIVPGLAFDKKGYRIGYGGGFYDTFLSSFPGISIGLCRPSSIYDDLHALKAIDRHDMPVDMMITSLSTMICQR